MGGSNLGSCIKGNCRAGRRGRCGLQKSRSHRGSGLAFVLAMPNHHDDMPALADMSAGPLRPGPIDTELVYPRLKRGALEAQAGGGALRTSEHPVALVQCTENRLAFRRLERRSAG